MEGIRGLAVLLVFFVHYHSIFSEFAANDSIGYKLVSMLGLVGNTGVDLFFVLSGYLIYGAVLKSDNVLTFYIRRVQRIYPTFFAVFIVYIFLSFVFVSESKIHNMYVFDGILYVAQNLALLPGVFNIAPIITVAWSLSYEVFFYTSIPIIVYSLKFKNMNSRARSYTLLLLILLGVVYLSCFNGSKVRFLMFFGGMLLWEFRSGKFLMGVYDKFKLLPFFLFISGLFCYFCIAGKCFKNMQLLNFKLLLWIYIAVAFSGFVYFAINNGKTNKILTFPPLRYLGNMSYSYYLIHGLALKGIGICLSYIFIWYELSGLSYMCLAVFSFAVTWIVGSVLFNIIEKPFSLSKST